MTVASETRRAVREHPFVYDALRAGILNYTAAARFLDVGETDAVGAALRRYAEELDAYEPASGDASVSMQSGVTVTDAGSADDTLFHVGDTGFAVTNGEYTAITATGDVDTRTLGAVLGRLRTAEIDVIAAGATDGVVTVVVERLAGADAVRAVENAV